MNKKIFLSYSRDDSKFVLKLVEDLKRNKFDIWIDQIDISGGKYWDNSIEQTIGNSCALVLIMSPSSAKSENVKDEVSYARTHEVDIIPIMYKKIKDNQIPFRWHRLQFIVMNEKNYDREIFSLIENINNLEKCGFVDIDYPPEKKYFKPIIVTGLLVGIALILYIFLKDRNATIYKFPKEIEKNITETVIDDVNVSKKNEEIIPIVISPVLEHKKEIKKQEKVKKEIETPKNIQYKIEKLKPTINIHKPIKKPKLITPPIDSSENKKGQDNIVCVGEYKKICDKLKQDKSLKLIITNHIDRSQPEDEAMKIVDDINYNLRDSGISRSRIETRIEKDSDSGVKFEFVR